MKTNFDYTVIRSYDTGKLAITVNDYLNHDYELVGGVAIGVSPRGETVFAQAVVKRTEVKTDMPSEI
jgi:hypothetical protein